jgi:hypothetical protein
MNQSEISKDDLAIIKPTAQVFWKEIKDAAESELESAERNYYRVVTFQKEIIKLAKRKLRRYEA